MSRIKIFTVPKGDKEALYVNGEQYCENPKITIYDLIPHVPIESLEILHIVNFDSEEDYFPIKESDFNPNWRFEEIL